MSRTRYLTNFKVDRVQLLPGHRARPFTLRRRPTARTSTRQLPPLPRHLEYPCSPPSSSSRPPSYSPLLPRRCRPPPPSTRTAGARPPPNTTTLGTIGVNLATRAFASSIDSLYLGCGRIEGNLELTFNAIGNLTFAATHIMGAVVMSAGYWQSNDVRREALRREAGRGVGGGGGERAGSNNT